MQEGKRRRNAKVQECKSTGSKTKTEETQECMNATEEGMQGCREETLRSSRVQGSKNQGMQECRNTRVQEYKGAGKQESRDARV
jgi:hypothetical protein